MTENSIIKDIIKVPSDLEWSDSSNELVIDALDTMYDKHAVLGSTVNIDDTGFVQLIDYYGSDKRIVASARQSYNLEDAKLTDEKVANMIVNMTKNGHSSPFEQCEITFKMCMPIFVARQLIRHRTASLNEASMRYTVSSGKYYIPTEHTWEMREDVLNASDEVKSMAGNVIPDISERAKTNYEHLIKGREYGDCENSRFVSCVPREIARSILPLGTYTEFIWKMDINNLRKMLLLRLDDHAQREIFQYAVAIFILTSKCFPETMDAFYNHQLMSITLDVDQVKGKDLADLGVFMNSKIEKRLNTSSKIRKEIEYLYGFTEKLHVGKNVVKE